ncbi:MAG: hypothetical protein FJ405_00855 [Verrucomicrobia bacterium]|nr:hypothetical protein [Verrucomicrobiota bacterium]
MDRLALTLAGSLCLSSSLLLAADPVFSGPQPGEPATPFKTIAIAGAGTVGEARDLVSPPSVKPLTLVFVHTVERSLIPLLRAVDQYAFEKKDKLVSEVVFLAQDRLSGEQRTKAASGSLKLYSSLSLSPDGIEGPGNYGLNKECMMTILVVTNGIVATNFALVQPGIADGPGVIGAMARIIGDASPPAATDLVERQSARSGGGRARRESMAGGESNKPKEAFPGAVPTDGELNNLIRQILRPTNDAPTVDLLLKQMEARSKVSEDLAKQARDAWVRVLHFNDRYGTSYAREAGKAFLQRLDSKPIKAPDAK